MKINTIFALMKKRRNIFLKIILLIIVFVCSGINVHSNSDTHGYYLNTLTDTSYIENTLTSGIDASDEDQMDKSPVFGLTEQPECQESDLITLSLLNILLVSVWQPPKVF